MNLQRHFSTMGEVTILHSVLLTIGSPQAILDRDLRCAHVKFLMLGDAGAIQAQQVQDRQLCRTGKIVVGCIGQSVRVVAQEGTQVLRFGFFEIELRDSLLRFLAIGRCKSSQRRVQLLALHATLSRVSRDVDLQALQQRARVHGRQPKTDPEVVNCASLVVMVWTHEVTARFLESLAGDEVVSVHAGKLKRQHNGEWIEVAAVESGYRPNYDHYRQCWTWEPIGRQITTSTE